MKRCPTCTFRFDDELPSGKSGAICGDCWDRGECDGSAIQIGYLHKVKDLDNLDSDKRLSDEDVQLVLGCWGARRFAETVVRNLPWKQRKIFLERMVESLKEEDDNGRQG